jgi:uncharacterized protein involved in oxidation of intracellular sulfur
VKVLFILNDLPYGNERVHNALRLALNLQKVEKRAEVTLFLIGDAVYCAKKGQNTHSGHYNIERILKSVLHKGKVLLNGSDMDSRGLSEADMVDHIRRSTLNELAALTVSSDKVLVF